MERTEQVIASRPVGEAHVDHPTRLRKVFEQHAPFVCRNLRRLGVAEADLDDMLQEVFLVVHQRLPAYEEQGRLRSWLYSICTRVALAQRRKVLRRREHLTDQVPEELIVPSQEQRVRDAQALSFGQHLLELLPKEQREVFVLYEVEEMSMSEVAAALGCPLQTAYSRLHRARSRVLAEVERARAGKKDP